MAAKRTGCFGAILSAVFTGVVAPVLVNVVSDKVKTDEAKPSRGERTWWTAPGVGGTPEAAARSALSNALHDAVSPLVGQGRDSQAVVETLLRTGDGLVLRCDEVAGWTAWQAGRPVYYKTLSVEVDGRSLRARLGVRPPARPANWNRPWLSEPGSEG